MVIEDYVYRNRILAALNNNLILFPDGSFKNNVEWFNQEDLLRTMKRMNKGMDKSRLREFLDELTLLKLVDKQEGKIQVKSQSKGEYQINLLGKQRLALRNQM